MPGKDGFEVAAFVRSRPELAGVAVVLLTGAFDALDEARVAQVGAAAVLVKPFEPQMVIAKVRDLLSGRPAPETAAAAMPCGCAACRHELGAVGRRLLRSPRQGICHAQYLARTPQQTSGGAPTHLTHPRRLTHLKHLTHPKRVQPPKHRHAVTSSTPGLADTFATLLAVEQGELPASALLPPPRSGDDELVDRIARRVVEQLGDRAVRDLAADIVSRTAERLVREEIERIKTGG